VSVIFCMVWSNFNFVSSGESGQRDTRSNHIWHKVLFYCRFMIKC
jgi:hypothetical protein